MKCTSPLYRLPIEYTKASDDLFLHGRKPVNGGYIFGRDDYVNVFEHFGAEHFQQIPCNQCDSCRKAKQLEWSIRCSKEAELHENNYFVTLTYNDSHLPTGEMLNLYTGEYGYTSTLRVRDFQLFMKRLRKFCEEEYNHSGVRVFYSGEYGDLRSRPHYHAILFNMPDLSSDFILRRAYPAYRIYSSPFIDRAWSDKFTGAIGIAAISECNFNTIAYTAKYAMKRYHGDNTSKIHQVPIKVNPFCHQSRRPGIAREWYEEHKHEIYETDSLPYYQNMRVHWSKPPRYFDKLYDIDAPYQMELIRHHRDDLKVAKFKFDNLSGVDIFARQDKEAERIHRLIQKRKEDVSLDVQSYS